MIRPAWASNPDSPITVARQRVPRRYQLRHRGRPVTDIASDTQPYQKLTSSLCRKWTCVVDGNNKSQQTEITNTAKIAEETERHANRTLQYFSLSEVHGANATENTTSAVEH